MTSGGQTAPFSIAPGTVDFGQVKPSASVTKNVTLTNQSGSALQFQVAVDQPWLSVRFGQQSGNDLSIILTVDPSTLPRAGQGAATLEVHALGHVQRVTVNAASAGSASSARPQRPSGRRAGGRTVHGGGASGGAGAAAPSAGRPTRPPAAPTIAFSPSLAVASLIHFMLLGSLYAFSQEASATGQAEQEPVLFVGLALACVYYFFAFRKGFPSARRTVQPDTADPQQQRLLTVLADVCTRGHAPVPRVVVEPDPRPNVRSYGFSARWGCLSVNQGLLQIVDDDDELAAALAHEVAHMKRFDTLFFSSVGPILWVISKVLFLMRGLFAGTSRVGRSMSLSPLMMMLFLRRGGGAGLLVMLVIVMALLMLFVLFLTYALFVFFGLLAAAFVCLLYCRYVEKAADLAAARIVGDSDLVLRALAACVDSFPGEMATLDRYMANCGSGGQKYLFDDIVRHLKAGTSAAGIVGWRQQAVRTHPTVLERIDAIVRTCGSKIA